MNNRRSWETEAENWVRWARTPGHDAYWYYRDAFFDRLVPPAGRVTLEVGCGEERVTRDLRARGHRVISVGGSMNLLRHATELDEARRYALADASELPIAPNSVDMAVVYNSLMDFDDLPRAVTEVARVLQATQPSASVSSIQSSMPGLSKGTERTLRTGFVCSTSGLGRLTRR